MSLWIFPLFFAIQSVFASGISKLLLGAFTFRIVFVFLVNSIKIETKEAENDETEMGLIWQEFYKKDFLKIISSSMFYQITQTERHFNCQDAIRLTNKLPLSYEWCRTGCRESSSEVL